MGNNRGNFSNNNFARSQNNPQQSQFNKGQNPQFNNRPNNNWGANQNKNNFNPSQRAGNNNFNRNDTNSKNTFNTYNSNNNRFNNTINTESYPNGEEAMIVEDDENDDYLPDDIVNEEMIKAQKNEKFNNIFGMDEEELEREFMDVEPNLKRMKPAEDE